MASTGIRSRLDDVVKRYEEMFAVAKANKKGELADEEVLDKMKKIRKRRKDVDQHNKEYIKAEALRTFRATDFLSYADEEDDEKEDVDAPEVVDDDKAEKEYNTLLDALDEEDLLSVPTTTTTASSRAD